MLNYNELLDSLIADLESKPNELSNWGGGLMPDGTRQLPFAFYERNVDLFFESLYDNELIVKGYGEIMDEKNWWDKEKMRADIPTMSKHELLTCVTAIHRWERFCEGNIASFIENGILLSLLKRLKEIG